MDKLQRNLACLSLLLGSGTAWAAAPSSEAVELDAPQTVIQNVQAAANADLPAGWPEIKVSDARLDEMRGGFDIAPGLQVAFGIERMVFINGQLVATTNFNIPNVSQITAQQAQTLASAPNKTRLVQNGPGNSYQPSPGQTSGAATIVQNTLNNQDIKALTTINATVNTLGAYKALNLQSTLNQAIANSVGVR